MTETDFKDTYTVEVEMRGLDDTGKHPVKTIEMSLVPYSDFVDGIKRNPAIKNIGVRLVAKNSELQPIQKDETPTQGQIDTLIDLSMITDEMLDSAAMIVIEQQHPGLLKTVTIKGGNALVKAVRDNDINEAFGLGEAIKALETITEKVPEPETEPSQLTMTDSTDSASTISSSEPDGAIEKS